MMTTQQNTAREAQALKTTAVKHLLRGFFLAGAFMAPAATLFAAGPAPVNLGSTAQFTILAGAAVTTTGNGVVNGDVGASPITGAAVHVTQAQVNGTIYVTDATGPAGSVIDPSLLSMAKGDLTAAYNDATGRVPTPTGPFLNPGAGNLAGLNLIPGLYKFTSTCSIAGGNVTLTGGPDDVWIFQVAADLEEGSNSQIILAGGAQARNIFWAVGTSATIGTSAVFKGTIIANDAITMDTTSATDGRLLAYSAGVTYDGSVGELPRPAAPVFTSISVTNINSMALVLSITPYFPVTLQSCTNLAAPNWTTVATNFPSASPWMYTDTNAMTTNMVKFYQAFITTTD